MLHCISALYHDRNTVDWTRWRHKITAQRRPRLSLALGPASARAGPGCRRSCLESCRVTIFAWEKVMQHFLVQKVGWRRIIIISQCRRAARSPPVLAVMWFESWQSGFLDSLWNSVFMLRDTKSAATADKMSVKQEQPRNQSWMESSTVVSALTYKFYT